MPIKGELAKAEAAQLKLAIVGTSPSTDVAAVHDATAVLGQLLALSDLTLTGHGLSPLFFLASEWKTELLEDGLGYLRCTVFENDVDVHSLCDFHLV